MTTLFIETTPDAVYVWKLVEIRPLPDELAERAAGHCESPECWCH